MLILSASAGSALALLRAGLWDGEPIIFPTDTIYGIGAPLASTAANEKIFAIKQRPKNKPMPVLIASIAQLHMLTDGAVDWNWPYGYTVIIKAAKTLDDTYVDGLNGTVAVRMLPSGWLRDAVAEVGPITATSVNLSGEAPLLEAEEIAEKFRALCPYMIWGTSGKTASTIIDLTTRRVVRWV